MESSLEDIAFLSNSENRIEVLRHLVDGPHSRHVIQEHTGVSRVTLGRILDELNRRNWITQQGQVCEITPLGVWIIEEFIDLCETLAAERRLREVYEWFPTPGYEFHLRHLADAEITRVHRADASAPITKLVKQFGLGGAVRAFSFAITSQFLEACWQHVMDETVTFEWVFTSDVLTVLRDDPTMASQSRDMLESGRVTYYHYPDEIPYVVIITDALVNLRLADTDGAATALIQSKDETVRSWGEARFAAYRDQSTPVVSSTFTG